MKIKSSPIRWLERYIFPRFILYNFFLFWLIFFFFLVFFWGLGGWGCGGGVFILVFWGWGFLLLGFGACGVGPSGFFWVRALYINIKE